MRLYLDNCALQRPLDAKSQLRILLEADAVLGLLEFCRRGGAELLNSDVLRFEIGKCRHELRREFAFDALQEARCFVPMTEAIRRRARDLVGEGYRPVDALHVASAEAGDADYFCTCDDGILKKSNARGARRPRILSPVELIAELSL